MCAILFAVPIVAATLGAVHDAQSAFDGARLEAAGLNRVMHLRELFFALSAERTDTSLGASFSKLGRERRRIDALVATIDGAERAAPLAGEAWVRVQRAWEAHPSGDEVPLFNALLRAFVRVSDRSRLTYDPENIGFALADAATARLPDVIERVQLFELQLHRMLRKPPGNVTDRIALAAAQSRITGELRFAYDDVIEAESLDEDVHAAAGPQREAAQTSTDAFVGHVGRFLRTGKGSASELPRLAGAAHAAVQTLAALEVALEPPYRAFVAQRVELLSQRRVLVVIPGLFGIIAAFVLALVIARNLRHRDELARVRRESERLAAEARFRMVFDGAGIGIVVIDRAGVVREANPAFHRMLGYANGFIVGKRLANYTEADDRDTTLGLFRDLVEERITDYGYEKRYVRADGSLLWADVHVSRTENDPGSWFAIGMIEDITERKRIESKLLYDATHDALTGLANRSHFSARLDLMLARRSEGTAAVVFIDLDHFKVVNDSLGHAAGDRLLCTVAERLQCFAGPDDTVARFGGDEFAVLFGQLAHVADLTRRVALIQERVAEPLDVDGRAIYTSASIGVAPLTPRYTNAEELLRDADTAMYRAKSEGRARAALFDHAMYESAVRRLQLTSDLRRAVENNELRLAYQPIVRLADRSVIAYEALMRWEHPRDGLLMPDDFVPLAEETGLIVGMGRWAIDRACERLARERRVNDAIAMHVNVSVQEIMQTDCATFIEERLAAHGVPPEALIVEITENAIIESSERSDLFLRRLRGIGVGICIDDFGVGYSSLRYLHRFPISGLKIDRSFVNGTDDDLASEPIVRMLLDLARTLGLDVVAEGIEHERQSAALQILGCLCGQGYLFSAAHVEDHADRESLTERY